MSVDTVRLGGVESVRTRHMRRRSSVEADGGRVYVGKSDGTLECYSDELEPVWEREGDGNVVSVGTRADGRRVVTGERGDGGVVSVHVSETGETVWEYDTEDDVGSADKEHELFYPFVVDTAADESRVFAVSRRYSRGDGGRSWSAAVYGFGYDGGVDWKREFDASPISVDTEPSRGLLGVAFNRSGDSGTDGLVVLDTETGGTRLTWDPEVGGDRRVGDVSMTSDYVAVASHADYTGYVLGYDGTESESFGLATPIERRGETVYAYPNHVHADGDKVVFVTGNTYAEETRKPESLHTLENTAVCRSTGGGNVWEKDVGGFVRGTAYDGSRLFVACSQNLRKRDTDAHGVRWFGLAEGSDCDGHLPTDGVVTDVSVDGNAVVAVEEPIEYDDNQTRGEYRLHLERFG